MVSALIETKRVADSIRAVSQVPDAHLVVAGDGPLRDTIDAMAAELLPGRFTRVSIGAHEMPTLYRSADVFMHPFKDESFGNVFLEATACGLPLVAHDSPRVRWIVGEQEYLLDTGEAGAVAGAIGRALQAPVSQREARMRRASDFAWSKVAKRYRDFFGEVLSARAATG